MTSAMGDAGGAMPGRHLDRDLGSPSAPGEAVESEIDRFIIHRHDQRLKTEGEHDLDAAWNRAEQREVLKRRADNGELWRAWHEHRAMLFLSLSAEHEAAAKKLGGGAA